MWLTLVRTEAPFLVIIVVVSGSAPQLAISSSLTGTGVVLFAQEHKGEAAGISVRVSTDCSGVCPNTVIPTTVRKNKPLWQHWHGSLWFLSLTSTGTESKFLVGVKVACGGTPAVTVTAALCGAAVIFFPQEDEGEDALGSVGISSKCVENCQDENVGRGWAGEASECA